MSDIYSELVKKHGLSSAHKKIIEIVGFGKIVLEVGSSTGFLTKEFVKNGCSVDIIEKNPKSANIAAVFARKTMVGSAEDGKLLNKIKGPYDVIILADILEHLVSPEIPLRYCLKILKADGKLVISLPNIAAWPARKELFFKGKFEYEESGLFDKTHLRFFSLASFKKFLFQNNVVIEKIIPTEIYLPFQRTAGKVSFFSKLIFEKVYLRIANLFPNLAYFHYIVIGKKRG